MYHPRVVCLFVLNSRNIKEVKQVVFTKRLTSFRESKWVHKPNMNGKKNGPQTNEGNKEVDSLS